MANIQELAIVPLHKEIDEENAQIVICDAIPTSSTTTHHQNQFFLFLEEFQRHFTHELLTVTILYIITTICFSHLVFGFEMLHKTGLFISVSPVVMSFFTFSFAIVTSHSLAKVDMYSRMFKASVKRTRLYLWWGVPLARFLKLSSTTVRYHNLVAYYTIEVLWIIGGFHGPGKYGSLVNCCRYLWTQLIVLPIGMSLDLSSDMVMIISIFTSFCKATYDFALFTSSTSTVLCFMDKSIKKLLPVVAARVINFVRKQKKIGKLISYAAGLVGTVLFQNFFRLTDFHEVKAFLYLATSWLANLTLINASHDFGIFNFLLGNVILGSTVNQSGLRITTWLTCCACLFLYILRINLKTLTNSESIGTLRQPLFLFLIFYCCIVFDCLHQESPGSSSAED